ncbi:MAG: TRAP transporter substrate-binding protein DctP [Eubacteriales bacterium]|nr:TRAP transporter substrate-binding protein DctP [Eubacteriales bacterium]
MDNLESSIASNKEDEVAGEEALVFRLAETMPKEHPSAKSMDYFANLVEERSDGKIKIKVYYDCELGTPSEILEQMKFGGIAMARVNSLELSDAVPAIRKYLTPERYTGPGNQIEWFHKSEELLRNDCQMEKITPLVWYYPDLRCFYSSNNAINSKSDLKGTKVKTTDCLVMNKLMSEMGARAAVDLGGMSIYRLLSSGDVQYGESGFCEFICNDYGKYIHYLRLTDYAYFPDVLLINTDSFNSLDPEKKKILEECAADTYEYQKSLMLNFKTKWTNIIKADDKIDFKEERFN